MGYAKQLMDSRMLITDSEATVRDLAKKMEEEHVRNIFIIKGGKPVGLVRDVDIVYKIAARNLNSNEVKAEQIMMTPAPMIDHKAGVIEVAKLMAEREVRRVLLMDGDKILGSVTAGSILKILAHLPTRAIKEAIDKIYY